MVDTAINDANRLIQRELGIYNFRDWRGWAAFLLDYTWGFPGTALGYGVQVINHFTPNSDYDPALSELVGSHVYRGGVGLPGFATTMGNVTTHLGTGYWLFHPNQDWFSLVETAAYYDNPWEVWAYANDNNWPPPGANPALLWPPWTYPVLLSPLWMEPVALFL
ncbi:MAG: hypothetical protein ACLP4W_15675 [Mycobacterium sp.]|uniref:hypothetical protein n=1 Tax=Mycobacterium sp. TaxID=1785 RepID=UPI003F97E328